MHTWIVLALEQVLFGPYVVSVSLVDRELHDPSLNGIACEEGDESSAMSPSWRKYYLTQASPEPLGEAFDELRPSIAGIVKECWIQAFEWHFAYTRVRRIWLLPWVDLVEEVVLEEGLVGFRIEGFKAAVACLEVEDSCRWH